MDETLKAHLAKAPERRAKARRKAQEAAVEQQLAGRVLPALAQAIAAAGKRGRPPQWKRYADLGEPLSVAWLILGPLMGPWRDDKPPSAVTVYRAIGRALGAPPDEYSVVGAQLLKLAVDAGVVEIVQRAPKRGGKGARPIKRVVPSLLTRMEWWDLSRRYAAQPARLGVRTKPPVFDRITISQNPRGLLAPPQPIGDDVAEALYAIGATKWRVNRYMLHELCNAPEVRAYMESQGKNGEAARHDVLSALACAEEWKDLPGFYFDVRCDFRGRVYQDAGCLQYTSGSDFARSLLEFGHGEPLTDEGRFWLGQYLAACYGVKGQQQRTEWTDKHGDQMAAFAADPWGARFSGWHKKAAQPYRFLAAAQAWVQSANGAPCHLPVAFDCSCSGLQHYALLMRDAEVGRMVGLVDEGPGSQGDFYSVVAKACSESAGKPIARSQVKSGAMTTFYGASAGTIAGKMWEDHPTLKRAPRNWAKLIRRQTWKAAGSPTRQLYGWLRQAARVAGQQPLRWTLPGGFRVRQDYREQQFVKHEVLLGGRGPKGRGRRAVFVERHPSDAIDIRAQARSVAPNFIHSMDAALLMETVRKGHGRGIRGWALAHDSFGAHPNKGGALFEAPRRAARTIYQQDVLGAVYAQLRRNGVDVPAPPEHPKELPAAFTMRQMTG